MKQISGFFSWQSEKQEVSDHIRSSLEACCEEVSKELVVDVSVIDADTNNRGSYNINAAVIGGIKNADFIVVDLTPTYQGATGRACPNANALYEYAFACATKGFDNVIAVVDVNEGKIANMPFDLNHNSVVAYQGAGDVKFHASLKEAVRRIVKAMLLPVLHEATTVFMSMRIAESFPGDRGLVTYDDQHDIRLHLEAFFKHPIRFGEATDPEGDPTPIWWFRGGSSEAIKNFTFRKDGVCLMGINEFRISKITVFSNPALYYKEYIYVETSSMKPVSSDLSDEKIKKAIEYLGYCDDEYGVVNMGGMEYNISRQEYDDGHAIVNGAIIPIRDKAEPRCRFVSPYNFIIAAKYSSINSDEFDRQSRTVMNDMLKGQASIDDLHNIILNLPKPLSRAQLANLASKGQRPSKAKRTSQVKLRK